MNDDDRRLLYLIGDMIIEDKLNDPDKKRYLSKLLGKARGKWIAGMKKEKREAEADKAINARF